ncbi:MAG: hypothetical protein ACPGUC_02360 [Gammaproteobacteria bacterium]
MKPTPFPGKAQAPELPPPRVKANLGGDVSGLLFDLDYRDDLAPYLVGHRRLKQIQDQPPLLVYAAPGHCDSETLLSHIRGSLATYPRLADSPADSMEHQRGCMDLPDFQRADEGASETHRLVLFASANPTAPLGYAHLRRRLSPAGEGNLVLDFHLRDLFVMPEHRGLGFGTALSVAAGICCGWEIRHQLERYKAWQVHLVPRMDTGNLGRDHGRLTQAMEGRIQSMMDRDMDAALSRCNACVEILSRS